MDKIIDNLFLGDIQGASNLFLLKRNGITHILQVAAGFKPFFPGEFKYKVINVLDMPYENLLKHFQSAIEFIKQGIKQGGTVLVHCFAGISRSASCVIAYLMSEHGMQMYDAMSHTRKRRPIIFPNPGFQKQLMDFERHLKSKRDKQKDQYQSPQKQQQQQLLATPKPLQKSNNLIEAYSASKKQQLQQQHQYISQSADKNQENVYRTGGFPLSHLRQSVERIQSKGYGNNMMIDRVQTSQNPLRRSTQDVQIKQEFSVNGRQNQTHLQGQQYNGKQPRARSSYGPSKNCSGAGIGPYPYQMRNNQEGIKTSNTVQSLGIRDFNVRGGESQSLTKYNSNNNHQHAPNSMAAASMYSSLTKKKNEQTESSYFNSFNRQELDQYKDAFSKSLNNLQYCCSLCQMPLFTSADILDHSNSQQLTAVAATTDRGKSSQQNLKDKFMVNANQIFGKTTSEGFHHGNFKCGSLFIKRKDWINEQDGSTGNIVCPRKSCAVKIGTYCWQGQRCSTCGQFVSPAFQMFRNRIQQGQNQLQQSRSTIQQQNLQQSLTSQRQLQQQQQQEHQSPQGLKQSSKNQLELKLNLSYSAEPHKRKQLNNINNQRSHQHHKAKQHSFSQAPDEVIMKKQLYIKNQHQQLLQNQSNRHQKFINVDKNTPASFAQLHGGHQSANSNHKKAKTFMVVEGTNGNRPQANNNQKQHLSVINSSQYGNGHTKSNINNIYQAMVNQQQQPRLNLLGGNLNGHSLPLPNKGASYSHINAQSPSKNQRR